MANDGFLEVFFPQKTCFPLTQFNAGDSVVVTYPINSHSQLPKIVLRFFNALQLRFGDLGVIMKAAG